MWVLLITILMWAEYESIRILLNFWILSNENFTLDMSNGTNRQRRILILVLNYYQFDNRIFKKSVLNTIFSDKNTISNRVTSRSRSVGDLGRSRYHALVAPISILYALGWFCYQRSFFLKSFTVQFVISFPWEIYQVRAIRELCSSGGPTWLEPKSVVTWAWERAE